MYHTIVKRIIAQGFANVSSGNYEALLRQCVPDVVHNFAGEHALGGVRHDKTALNEWFHRVGRLLPNFNLEITDMVVKGMPWNTTAVVQWTGRSPLVNGKNYVQHGVHFLSLKWGKVHAFRIYVDTQELAHTLEGLAQFGVAEAAAEPIRS